MPEKLRTLQKKRPRKYKIGITWWPGSMAPTFRVQLSIFISMVIIKRFTNSVHLLEIVSKRGSIR